MKHEPWRTVAIPPRPGLYPKPRALIDGFEGGLLAVTTQANPQPGDQGFSGDKMVLWSIRANGTLDKEFASDGSLTLATGNPYEAWDIGGLGIRSQDGSLLIQTGVADSGSDQRTSTSRVTRRGDIDGSYTARHEPLRDSSDEDLFDMSVVADGSVRFCRTTGSGIELWGLDQLGDEDDRIGSDGHRVIANGDRCGGLAAHPDGDLILAAQRTQRSQCSTDVQVQVELLKLEATGAVRAGWGGGRFPQEAERESGWTTYRIVDVAVADDGGVLVVGIVGDADVCGSSSGGEIFVMRADPDGTWDRGFGRDGMATFDLNATIEAIDIGGSVLAIGVHREEREGNRSYVRGGLFSVDALSGVRLGRTRWLDRGEWIGGVNVFDGTIAVLTTGRLERFPIN